MIFVVTQAAFEQECKRRGAYETSLDTVTDPPALLFHAVGDTYPFRSAFGYRSAGKFYLFARAESDGSPDPCSPGSSHQAG